MPEYLAPGVYVEEVSFRAKSVEGVPSSTAGFAGLTRYGPVHYRDGPSTSQPRLITSFAEFERVYGGLDPLQINGHARVNYLAHAARAFFINGGKRLYVSRVFLDSNADPASTHVASLNVGAATWRARWPGKSGNVQVETRVRRSDNLAFRHNLDPGDKLARHLWGVQVQGATNGSVVELTHPLPKPPETLPGNNDPLQAENLYVVKTDSNGRQTFVDRHGAEGQLPDDLTDMQVLLVELEVVVTGPGSRADAYQRLCGHKNQKRYIGKVLDRDKPEEENAIVYLDYTYDESDPFTAARLMVNLHGATQKQLAGGDDGKLPGPGEFEGKTASPGRSGAGASGLEALGPVDEVAIVALPDAATLPDLDLVVDATRRLIAHAEKYRYRTAVVDSPPQCSISEVRTFRSKFDSSYAAMYYPWIEILDPLAPAVSGTSPDSLLLPPSGFVCGIYSRSDIERGVHKAPANEIVRGLTRFEVDINKAHQEVLNSEGVNCLRFFEGRGNRVWGARTMSSDPEWKYVNVRRLFIHLEHSLDKATQWVVFEPNNERLWANVRRMMEDFLLARWQDGALLGQKPEQAFFVRCDRSTMTQNDLNNGRMVCLIGVAPTRPAEFVIFRIGQWTADTKT